MNVTSIAFTMYPVSDMPRAVAFYRDGLGLREGEHTGEVWVEFDIGGGTFGIGNFEQVGTPGTARSLAIEVDDLVGFRKALVGRNIESTEPHELANCSISLVRDPDGNQIWLHQINPR